MYLNTEGDSHRVAFVILYPFSQNQAKQGDSDTVGAIVGSLAEARFGLDEEMAKKALEYLPEDMREVVRLFKERHYLCAKA